MGLAEYVCQNFVLKSLMWAGEMAELVKALAAQPRDLSVILRPTWQRERTDMLSVFCSDPDT